jgi:23S rRNA (pseudouridine1915-N3)-methyltransferase
VKITFLTVGKTAFKWVEDGSQEYLKRLVHYTSFSRIELPDIKQSANMPREVLKAKEGELILSKISDGDTLVLLDERGKKYSSEQFATMLEKWMMGSSRNLFFVVGGAYGFSEEVYKRANSLLSISDMTFSHQMVRVVFLEQLYRGFTIVKGEPYHHR